LVGFTVMLLAGMTGMKVSAVGFRRDGMGGRYVAFAGRSGVFGLIKNVVFGLIKEAALAVGVGRVGR